MVLADGTAYTTAHVAATFAKATINGSDPGLDKDPADPSRVRPGRASEVQKIRVLICRLDCSARCQDALACMWEKREFTDCEVVCNGQSIKCHRAVLSQASPVFTRMLAGEMSEARNQRIELEAPDSEVAVALLAFVYTGTLNCKAEHVPALVKLADFCQLDCLVDEACRKMLSELTKDTVVAGVRALKGICERPQIAPHWEQLGSAVGASKELALALMAEA